MSVNVLYQTSATATGGREGHAASKDGTLDVVLTTPKELGGAGKPGNNPFCYHRVTQLRRKGVRERLVPVERAPGKPYDHGRFEIQLESWDAEDGGTAPSG